MNTRSKAWRRHIATLPKAARLRAGLLTDGPRKRAVIFARVASYEASPKALHAQLSACRLFAEQHQLSVVKRYHHVGAGTRGPRPDLTTLFADAESGLFDVLVVQSRDRLSRDCASLVASIDMFKSLGVEVQSVLDGGPVYSLPLSFRRYERPERVGRKRKKND